LAEKPSYDQAYTKFDEADTRIVEATQVIGLSKASFRLKQDDFNVLRPADGNVISRGGTS
jgi:hypothetical protein